MSWLKASYFFRSLRINHWINSGQKQPFQGHVWDAKQRAVTPWIIRWFMWFWQGNHSSFPSDLWHTLVFQEDEKNLLNQSMDFGRNVSEI